jgi:hypothetical protein
MVLKSRDLGSDLGAELTLPCINTISDEKPISPEEVVGLVCINIIH